MIEDTTALNKMLDFVVNTDDKTRLAHLVFSRDGNYNQMYCLEFTIDKWLKTRRIQMITSLINEKGLNLPIKDLPSENTELQTLTISTTT